MQNKSTVNIELDANYKRLINVTIDGKKLSFEVSDDGPNPELISCSQNQFEAMHRQFALGYWYGCFDENGRVEAQPFCKQHCKSSQQDKLMLPD